ncbi:MAG: glycosyltransferase family 2 protein [Desulfuromonadales bacterium]
MTEFVEKSPLSISEQASPAVGVLVVVHNRKEDLFRLLKSLFLSDYQPFEVLVLDDHSDEDLSDVERNFPVEYIRLEENLGFVAGMTKGLQHLLQKKKYRYLWVLDSDLEVAPDALRHLVNALNGNEEIGVAGCVIYNTYNRNLVVESGALVDLRTGIITAKNCNVSNPSLEKLIETDFIASGGGGSLINVRALQSTGLHDVRYCFLWEDTDFGLCLKQHGYRVVVVSDAIVYHPPFTEKRNPNIYAYYGVRNPLLTVAKHASNASLPFFLFGNLSRCLRISLLMGLSGCKGFARLTFKGITDFIAGRFGKADLVQIEAALPIEAELGLRAEKLVFLIGTGEVNAIETAVSALKVAGVAEVVLVIQSYRLTLVEGIAADSLLTYDDHVPATIREYLRVGMRMLKRGGCIVNTDLKGASPLSYFAVRVYDWDISTGMFRRSSIDLYAIWKPVSAVVLGKLLALLFLPPVLLAALKHRSKDPEFP